MVRFTAVLGSVAAVFFAVYASAVPGPVADSLLERSFSELDIRSASPEKRDNILGQLFNTFGTKLVTHINGELYRVLF
jgi:hypothetical protein